MGRQKEEDKKEVKKRRTLECIRESCSDVTACVYVYRSISHTEGGVRVSELSGLGLGRFQCMYSLSSQFEIPADDGKKFDGEKELL